MKIVSKDFCIFTGIYTAIYMDPCRRPYTLLVPTSKLSDIKFSHYPDGRYILFTCTRTGLSAIPIKLVFFFFSSNLFPCFLWLNFVYWLTCYLYRFRCNSATAYVLHNFSNVLADWYLWLYLHWLSFCEVFFAVYFLLDRRKKDRKKACKKCSSKLCQKYPSMYSFKRKYNFCNLDNSFRKITWFV